VASTEQRELIDGRLRGGPILVITYPPIHRPYFQKPYPQDLRFGMSARGMPGCLAAVVVWYCTWRTWESATTQAARNKNKSCDRVGGIVVRVCLPSPNPVVCGRKKGKISRAGMGVNPCDSSGTCTPRTPVAGMICGRRLFAFWSA
jgi:hypothetical protein